MTAFTNACHDEYVMVICHEGLGKVASLAARAVRELGAEPAPSS